jgi:hypothetical protein
MHCTNFEKALSGFLESLGRGDACSLKEGAYGEWHSVLVSGDLEILQEESMLQQHPASFVA